MEAFAYKPEPVALWGVLPIYGILSLIGFGLALAWSYYEWNKKGLRHWDYVQVVSFATIGALYGAKLWYIIFDPTNALAGVNDILDILFVVFIPATGRSIIGTAVFTPIAIWGVSKYNPDVKFRQTIDILLPSILIGQFVARWGNFANHQVFGQAVEQLPNWMPQWIKDNMYIDYNGVVAYRQPLFLYESMTDFLTFIFIIMVVKRIGLKDGSAGAVYLLMYGIFRTIFEPMRDHDFMMMWVINGVEIWTSFIAAIVLTFVGTGMLVKYNWGK